MIRDEGRRRGTETGMRNGDRDEGCHVTKNGDRSVALQGVLHTHAPYPASHLGVQRLRQQGLRLQGLRLQGLDSPRAP